MKLRKGRIDLRHYKYYIMLYNTGNIQNENNMT